MASSPHIRAASLKRSPSRLSLDEEKIPAHTAIAVIAQEKQSPGLYPKFRPYILTALALLILGWWISATVLKATRHRWYALDAPPFASHSLICDNQQDCANHLCLGFYSVGMLLPLLQTWSHNWHIASSLSDIFQIQ